MRLTELLGRPVVDSTGARVGGVADVVLDQLSVAGLVVARRRHARLLGYERELRPVLLRGLARLLAGDVLAVDWADVAEVSAERVLLRVPRSELAEHHREHRDAPRGHTTEH
jgi:sporulation protein YlmC with PRC-barrel domain